MVKRKATDNSTVPLAPKKPKLDQQLGVGSSHGKKLFPSTQEPPGTPVKDAAEMRAKGDIPKCAL